MFQIDNLSNSQPIRCSGNMQRLAILGGKGAHRTLFRDNHKIKNNFGFPGTKGIGRFFGSNQLQPDAG
jgi:hypothetical protein